MSFAEQMQVATLVLDYLKVVLGYPVTIPALVAFLCWIFRERIGTKIDSVRALTYKGASVQFAERAALVPYAAAVEQTSRATARSAARDLSPEQLKTAKALASFFDLAARLLPLIPKAEPQQQPGAPRARVGSTLDPEHAADYRENKRHHDSVLHGSWPPPVRVLETIMRASSSNPRPGRARRSGVA